MTVTCELGLKLTIEIQGRNAKMKQKYQTP